jgi:hypothetical protein
VFTVEALYLNFPHIRQHYFWPERLRAYLADVQRRRMRVAPITIIPIKAVDAPPGTPSELSVCYLYSFYNFFNAENAFSDSCPTIAPL